MLPVLLANILVRWQNSFRSPVKVRASSLAELFDCPARWEAKNILKKYIPSSDFARLGTAVHAATAAYDLANLNQAAISIDDAISVGVDSIHSKDEETFWSDLTPQSAENISVSLVSKYCRNIAPTQQYVGIEVTCPDLPITDLGLILTGTIDRVRQENGEYGIADIKTGKTAVNAQNKAVTAGHKPQLAIYELLVSHAINQEITAPAQIIGMQTGATDKAQRIAIGLISNARDMLIGNEFQSGLLQNAANLIHSGNFYGNSKSYLCGVKYCPIYDNCRFK